MSEHGTTRRYRLGCRCDLCREAVRVAREKSRRRAGVPTWEEHIKRVSTGRTHGRIATYNAGCRCPECKAVASDKRAAYRARKKREAAA